MSAAEVLAQHVYSTTWYMCSCSGWEGDTITVREFSAHLLDALRTAGYAVVELPEVETDEWGDRHVVVPIHGQKDIGQLRIEPPYESRRTPGLMLPARIRDISIPMPVSVLDAPALAAGLLAAAEAEPAGKD